MDLLTKSQCHDLTEEARQSATLTGRRSPEVRSASEGTRSARGTLKCVFVSSWSSTPQRAHGTQHLPWGQRSWSASSPLPDTPAAQDKVQACEAGLFSLVPWEQGESKASLRRYLNMEEVLHVIQIPNIKRILVKLDYV